ncbi:NUDIX hydrolase [Paracoccus siganidrum]|uniref:NUDIX domain-containing protein n=2 Tax=Paracoccus siganidrum TaxID=1276757 RepID=A0A418ZV15_9RHOB|nr:NUDIX domain-containing protein [Paracoccus siganidrum]RMC37166.1 NUDIX hydrolase [Paracoccus siganidrum]
MQVAALCLDPETGKVLLITSRGTGRWIIPKGWPMEGRTLPAAAALEAWEEAGAEGRIGREEIGRYSYDKDQDSGFAVPVEVRVYPLHVTRLSGDFPESAQRKRRWFTPRDAIRMVAEPGLKALLRGLPKAEV